MTAWTDTLTEPLDLRELRAANVSRAEKWHDSDALPWSGADWSNAMCGEAGEAANVVKKMRRIETNIAKRGDESTDGLRQMLGDELADVLIYADLLANHYGLDLAAHVRGKFNEVSERHGFEERL